MKYTISTVIQNAPGVTTRVTGLVARRGFNISSLVAAQTVDPDFFSLTIILDEPSRPVTQVLAQLDRLVNVMSVAIADDVAWLKVGVLLVKVDARERRREILRRAEELDAQIVDDSQGTLILAITGDTEMFDSCLSRLEGLPIREALRTGPIAMRRGNENV